MAYCQQHGCIWWLPYHFSFYYLASSFFRVHISCSSKSICSGEAHHLIALILHPKLYHWRIGGHCRLVIALGCCKKCTDHRHWAISSEPHVIKRLGNFLCVKRFSMQPTCKCIALWMSQDIDGAYCEIQLARIVQTLNFWNYRWAYPMNEACWRSLCFQFFWASAQPRGITFFILFHWWNHKVCPEMNIHW